LISSFVIILLDLDLGAVWAESAIFFGDADNPFAILAFYVNRVKEIGHLE
jgi:hypothetical protein